MTPLDVSDPLKIEMRKLCPPKVEGVKIGKKKHKTLQSQSLNTSKILCMLLCSYYGSKMICRTEGDAPIAL
jgi:hypothetical protein